MTGANTNDRAHLGALHREVFGADADAAEWRRRTRLWLETVSHRRRHCLSSRHPNS